MFEKTTALVGVVLLTATSIASAHDRGRDEDFGSRVQRMLESQTEKWFGLDRALRESAPETVGDYRTPTQQASDQVLLARGLKVRYLTREAADATDMMAFFPAQDPTHLITCVEGNREDLGGGKFNPSVQRIHLDTGAVATILRGMSGCDGIRTTPWGTILATEEESDGGAYEILDPLTTTEVTLIDRTAGSLSDPVHVAKRSALPTMAWEGIVVLPSGVVIGGDELRPGSGAADVDGGAVFKFLPAVAWDGTTPVTMLGASPLAAGSVYAMQVSCQAGTQQYGQGCEIGNAAWIPVDAATARTDADAGGATGYYRPEDMHDDPLYEDDANPDAVRYCWTNTGNEGGANYAEVMCAVDTKPSEASATERAVVVNRFVEGDLDFNSFDNLAFQPKTGNLYVIEDHDNGDVFACLRDGADRDIESDGCVRVLSVKDSSAEPTGFLFAPDGCTAYLSIQHSDDGLMPLFDDYATDDVVEITGFEPKGCHGHHDRH
jgi:hypothetical protein